MAPDLRLDADNMPAESTWAWRGLDVHLDRYETAAAGLTVIPVLKSVVLDAGDGSRRVEG
jgi:hypothetical protein